MSPAVHRIILISACLALLLLAPTRAQAQCDEAKLAALGLILGGPQADAGHGTSVAMTGNLLLVGTPDATNTSAFIANGWATLYVWNGVAWLPDQLFEVAVVTASIDIAHNFGFSVDLSADGQHAIVGAPGLAPGVASVVVTFTNFGGLWLYDSITVETNNPEFGYSVAAASRAGNVVYAMGDPLGGPNGHGQVTLLDATKTLRYIGELSHGGTIGADRFGHSVGLGYQLGNDLTLMVGAPDGDVGAVDGGGAYFYRDVSGTGANFGSAVFESNSVAGAGAAMGTAVSLDGLWALAGAPLADTSITDGGRWDYFRWDGVAWAHHSSSAGNLLGGRAGASVDISGDHAAVGQPETGAARGSMRLEQLVGGSWTSAAKTLWTGSDSASGDRFGSAVAVSANRAAAGAPLADQGAVLSAGATYVFDFGGGTWQDLGAGLTGFGGLTPRLTGIGGLCGDDALSLDLVNARPNAGAYLAVGLAALNAPLYGGTLVPDIFSPPGTFLGLPTNGLGQLPIHATWPTGVPGGLGVYLQYWIADVDGIFGFSASNGLKGTTP